MKSILTPKADRLRRTLLTPALALLACTLPQTMKAALLAGTDSFAAATTITLGNEVSNETVLQNFTVENGEPGHFSNGDPGASKSAWWQWTAPEDGFCTVDTLHHHGDDFIEDPILAVYTGATVNALTRVTGNDDHGLGLNGAGRRNSSATFYAIKGINYHIAVDGFGASNVTAAFNKVVLRLRHIPAKSQARLAVFGLNNDPALQGHLSLMKTAGNSFSAKLTLGGKIYPFSGVFGVDGYFCISFARTAPAGSPPLIPVTLWIDGATGGSLNFSTGDNFTNPRLWDVITFNLQTPNTIANAYTALLKSSDMEGSGSFAMTVKPTGAVTGAGVAPDGTAVTFASSVCARTATHYTVPVYQNLVATKGFTRMELVVMEAGTTDLLSTPNQGSYFRAAKPASLFYPAGISTFALDAIGSTYTKPAAGQRALTFLNGNMGNGQLVVPATMGEIANTITKSLLLSTLNKFTFASPLPEKPLLTLNAATGLVTGTIIAPAGKTRTLRGALVMHNGTPKLEGFVSGATKNVKFSVTP